MRRDFLLDTSFLSASFPRLQSLPMPLEAWVIEHEHRFHLSSVVVAEIMSGIAKIRRREEDPRRASAYEEWLKRAIQTYADRILDLDVEVAYKTGELLDYAVSIGENPGFADIAIAATASVHNLTVLTRNLKHFTPLGVPCADPFEALPR